MHVTLDIYFLNSLSFPSSYLNFLLQIFILYDTLKSRVTDRMEMC